MRVLIAGCGYIGCAVGAQLVSQGHRVAGLGRFTQGDAELQRLGIVPLQADLTKPETLPLLSHPYDWVVHCVSTRGGGAAQYEELYVRGTQNLLAWLSAAAPAKLVYTSSTSVYGQNDGRVVDESSPTAPESQTARILLETEKLVLSAANQMGFSGIVLRVAGIYGPGRTYWLKEFQSGRSLAETEPKRVLNMVHRDDVVGAIVAALSSAQAAGIYNLADDQPVTRSALFQWFAARLGNALLTGREQTQNVAKRGLTNKRVSNRRLKEQLGYQLKFPTFKEGYEALLA
jgi:nucleoside-diphosphate-sugar epimerase